MGTCLKVKNSHFKSRKIDVILDVNLVVDIVVACICCDFVVIRCLDVEINSFKSNIILKVCLKQVFVAFVAVVYFLYFLLTFWIYKLMRKLKNIILSQRRMLKKTRKYVKLNKLQGQRTFVITCHIYSFRY